jgi:D-alanyl-D-alanine carboxypeptidase
LVAILGVNRFTHREIPMRLSTFSSLFVLLTFVAAGRADTAPKPPKSFDVKAIDEYLTAQVTTNGYVGLSVAIVRDGKVVLAKGYGKATIKPEAAVETSTPFAAGSVTKQFTCACILLLAEDGKLSVRDKVSKYYPGLTKADEITLYELMTHVSGYPDYYPLDFVDRRMMKPIPPDDLIKEYAGGKLDFAPGSRWSYSNTGFVLLGRIVEKVSGKQFGEFLAERILKPLGMADTVFDPKPEHKGLATGFTAFALGDPEPAVREADGWIHAAGALYTTASDLAKWDLALIGGKVLNADSYRLMTTPREIGEGRTRDYGCGIGVRRMDGELVLSHSGAVSGFLAHNAILPRTKSAVVLLSNAEQLDTDDMQMALLNLVRNSQPPPGRDVPKISGPPAKDVALDLFHQLQAGEVKRETLGDDYNQYLTPERVRGAKDRLKALGEPDKIETDPASERGGMEVVEVHFTFKSVKLKALLYRSPDGKVQEFLIYKS